MIQSPFLDDVAVISLSWLGEKKRNCPEYLLAKNISYTFRH